MKLTPAQVKEFWRLWPQACRANSWTKDAGLSAPEIDARRKEFLAGCGFKSLTLVDRTDGFTKVLNGLKVLIGTSVKAGMEVNDPTLNKARNFKHVILNELMPCLALYEDDVEGYITTIMEDKNRWWKIDRPARDITLEDLDAKPVFRFKNGERKEYPSTLEQLMMTINARIHSKRNLAGHSIHDMKIAAKVECDCARCDKLRMRGVVLPTLAHGTDDSKVSAKMLDDSTPDWGV